MKILVDLRKLSYKPSGIGIYTYNLIKGVINNSDTEIIGVTDIIVSDEIKELSNIIKIHVFGTKYDKNYMMFPYFYFVKKIVKEINPDYFYEPNYIVPINIKTKKAKTKVMINIHDISPLSFKSNYSIVYRLYFKFFLKRTLKYTDRILYISKEAKKEIEYRLRECKKIDSDIVYPIIKRIDVENIIDENYFLFIGNVEKRKGIDILLNSFKQYVDLGGEKELVIAGKLNDKNISDEIQKGYEYTSGRIKYLGYVDDVEKIDLLRRCSAFVFPSYSEGFGIPPIEALSLNKPIIVSNIKVFQEVYANCANYFQLDVSDLQNSSNSLKDKLFNYTKPNVAEIDQLLDRYSEVANTNTFLG